jgi:glutamate-ammonia-ligase adenylyltransferase
MDVEVLQILNEPQASADWLRKRGVSNLDRADINLKAIAGSGMTLDLVAHLFRQLESHLVQLSDPDMAINNLERFILAARSPLALGALFERDPTALPILLTIFSTSQYLADLLIRDRESYDALRLSEGQPYTRDVLVRDLGGLMASARDSEAAMTLIRRFKHRETLRIAFGDLVAEQRMADVTEQISFVAEAACEAAFEFCFRVLAEKWGHPRLANGEQCGYCILAMGKLGGRELNYSSDIDLVMVYQEDGECDGSRSRTNREFYEQLTREFAKLLNESTRLGVAYRVDLRLRPEGSKGRLCNSFDQMVRYYESKGRTWERQALIKLRPIAGEIGIGERLVRRLQPWVYRRRLTRLDISEIKALKRKIERRAVVDGVERLDVKTGHGGIRDIEFAIQFLQLSYGGSNVEVRHCNTLEAIERLQLAGCLTLEEETLLSQNYVWLRKLEHRLQIMFDLQTHTLPDNEEELPKIAQRMGYQDYFGKTSQTQFQRDLGDVTEANRGILNHLLHDAFSQEGMDGAEEVPIEADLVLDENPDPESIVQVFSKHGFADAKQAYKNFGNLAMESTAFLSPHRCRHFLAAISAKLLQEISQTPDPDCTLNSLAGVSDKIGAKGVLWELFHSHPPFMELYVRMCACGEYLTSILKSNPGMVDELVDSLALESLPTWDWLSKHMEDLVQSAEDIGPIVHSFKQAQHLRVGIRDIVGQDPIQEKHLALSNIAQVCLTTVINHEYEILVEKYGVPLARENEKNSELVVLALGKLGGREPNYHSDLDVIFLYDEDGQTSHVKPRNRTSNQHFFSDLAAKVTKSVTYNGPNGRLYEMDSRLRPTGKSGALALSLAEFERYYASGKGQFWERLALCKARVIYGAEHAARRAVDFVNQALSHPAFEDSMFDDAFSMRIRMQEGSRPSNLKRGVGGTVDVEFIVQVLQLKHATSSPAVRQQGTLRALAVFVEAGVIPKADGESLSDNYRLLRQVESGLRLMNRTARHDLPSSDAEFVRLAYLLGFATAVELQRQVESARAQNRELLIRWLNQDVG